MGVYYINIFKGIRAIILTNRMAALISALDQLNGLQCGENNHVEYTYSKVHQERILQLSFQLVRTTDSTKRQELANIFVDCYKNGTIDERKTLIKLLAHTRDIEEGKGEYAISFSILKELMELDEYRELGISIVRVFVGFNTNGTTASMVDNKHTPMGSWKDIKYLCNELETCPQELIQLINHQLRIDLNNMNNNHSCSLLAKWIPREKSKKFGWINKLLAMNYFQHFGTSSSGWTNGATNKAQTYYRKVVSSLNRYIDTVQVKQCGQTWNMIDFNKVTSITMMKQRKAFLNSNNVNSEDRLACRQHLLDYMERVKQGEFEIKGRRTGMLEFVKAAIQLSHNTSPDSEHERFIINEAWKNNSRDTKSLENMIAMVDTSGSMELEDGRPLYSAIGLGIRVAEKSKLGKRVMTFDANPTWVNLDGCKDFVEEVQIVKDAGWGMNTNFHKAMNLILDQIKKYKLAATDVENLVLVVFSDMQFDQAISDENICATNNTKSSSNRMSSGTLDEPVRQILVRQFHDAGIEICGKGYKVPHVVFWNMRSTRGFPELSYQTNVTMLSGYSPQLLNSFAEEGMVGLKELTPWGMLTKMLNKERYNVLEALVQ